MNTAKVKNYAILFLCLLAVVQAAWIISLSPDSGRQGPAQIKEARVTPDGFGIEVALTSPVDMDALPVDEAASLEPEIQGSWMWGDPSLLRFTSEEPLGRNTQYTVTLSPELGVEGGLSVDVLAGVFQVESISLSERAGDEPRSAVISAALRFSDSVSPEDLLKNVTLTDESSGDAIPLQAMTSWESSRIELRSEPVEKTAQGRTYRLTVAKELKPSGSDLALVSDAVATIGVRFDTVLRFRGADPWFAADGGGVRLVFSTPMDAETAARFISVEPDADYTLNADGNRLVLSGGFEPGGEYTVMIQEGLAAADGAVLEESRATALDMPDVPPSVDFVGAGLFLPQSSRAGLAVEAVNAARAELRVHRVYPNNLYSMLREYGSRIFDSDWDYSGVPSSLGGALLQKGVPVSGERNQTVRRQVLLDDVIGPGDRGLYKFSLSIPGERGVKRWLAVTDLGLMAKRDKEKFLVWAVSNKTLEPLAGVRLTLVSDKNQPLAEKRTSAAGTATLPLPEGDAHGSPYMILAEAESGDFSFLLPSRFGVDTTGLDVAGVEIPPAGLRAYIYGERDLYRPGETLRGVALIRQSDLAAPPGMPLVLIHTDPRGRELRRVRLQAGAQGMAGVEMPLPDYTLTGGHSLTLKAGDETVGTFDFKVEEFVPDRIKVEVETGEDGVAPGQSVSARVRSSYLFGPPSAGLTVTVRGVLMPAPFSAKGFEDYEFGDPDREFEPKEFFSEQGTLDEEGMAGFTLDVPSGLKPPAALDAAIYGRVSETGGRGVTARKIVKVHPYACYIGVKRLGKSGFDANKPITFDYVSVDAQGSPCGHGELEARLFRDRWRTVVRRTPSGGFRYESVNDPELLASKTIPAGSGRGSVRFTPPDYGSYRVVIASPETGASARAAFFTGGWGYSPWALENPARVELLPDKDQYLPGETAVIQVRAPFPGRLLVAVEGDSVFETRVIDLAGNTGEARFTVKASYAPNVHVTAMLVRKASDIAEGSVGRAFGAAPLLVDNLSNRMALKVSAPDAVRPESELSMVVDAEPGAVVTIAAVDEGVMQLSGADDPDPFVFFYARRALGVESFDTFAMLYPDLARVMGGAEAGGGMALAAESQFMRTAGIRRVKPVSFWSGPLVADAQGKVRYAVTLPDFQGALRIVAVGAHGKRFGTARAMARVRSPLAVAPTLPRFLAAGDTMEMPVTVRNDLGRDADIEVGVTAQGMVESSAGPQSIRLADGAEQTLFIPVSARPGPGGPAKVTVTATAGEEVRRVVAGLPVQPAAPFRREARFGALAGAGEQLVPAAEGYVPGTVTRKAVIGSLPLVRFSGKFEDLLGYPYGCAEQVASKAFPLIRFENLAAAFAPQLGQDHAPALMVQSAIQRLRSMQAGNGGFSFWPGGWDVDDWVSAYATHFLLEAAQAGFTSPGMLEMALDHMSRLGSMRQKDTALSAYALFNLAKAGRPDRGSMDELRDRRARELSAMGRTLLACAYAMSGDMDSFGALIRDMPKVREGREQGGGMGSALRDASLMLLALLDAEPDSALAPELAAKVVSLLSGRSVSTTQEQALAFTALGKALEQGGQAPIDGALVMGEEPFAFRNAVTFGTGEVAGGGPVSARLETEAAKAYWSVTTRGVPAPETLTPISQGLKISRAFLDRHGEPLDAASLEQGQLVLMKTVIESTAGGVDNVVVQMLLPAGLEVENPRLESSEIAAFAPDDEPLISGRQDLRDDRVLFFADIGDGGPHVGYTQLRAVVPGDYALPPAQAEAMYDPSIMARSEPGRMAVARRK